VNSAFRNGGLEAGGGKRHGKVIEIMSVNKYGVSTLDHAQLYRCLDKNIYPLEEGRKAIIILLSCQWKD
jgi:hypothetical protein